MTRLRRMWLAS